jgi:hypothetical protein
LTLLKFIGGTETAQTVIGVAGLLALGVSSGRFGNKCATLDPECSVRFISVIWNRQDLRVDKNIPRFEIRIMRPSTRISNIAATWEIIIFWQNIDICDLTNICTFAV